MLNNKNIANAFVATQNLIQFSIENFEKSTQLQFNASKELLNDTFFNLKGITKVVNVKDLFAYTSEVANASLEKNVATFNQACALVNASQSKFGKIFAGINESAVVDTANKKSVKKTVTK